MEKVYYLSHHGVLGMKWGVRRSKKQLARASKKREPHEDYKQAHSKKKIKYMSNDELRSRNNRLGMENQYRDLKSKSNKGRRIVNAYIAGGATVAGIMTATAAYQKYGRNILRKAAQHAP